MNPENTSLLAGGKRGEEGQPDLRDLLVLRLEENPADQAVPHSSPLRQSFGSG